MFNQTNVFILFLIFADLTAFQTRRSLWSRGHRKMPSGTWSLHLFTPIPLHPPSLIQAQVHLSSPMGGWLTLPSAPRAAAWLCRRRLPLRYFTVPQVSSSLTNLILLRRLMRRVTDRRLLHCHPSPVTRQSS